MRFSLNTYFMEQHSRVSLSGYQLGDQARGERASSSAPYGVGHANSDSEIQGGQFGRAISLVDNQPNLVCLS